jgi:hypothetical protein
MLSECLEAPADYFLPARVLRILRDRAGFGDLRITLEGGSGGGPRVFASILESDDDTSAGEDISGSSCLLGPYYRLEIIGIAGAERMLSLLGASLAAPLKASRPPCLRHDLPQERPPSELAAAASARFADSQAACATLCVLDTGPFLESAGVSFPQVDPECLAEDLVRCLAAYFESSGGLFLCDTGELAALCCGARPVDTGLLQSQLVKYVRKFISPALDAPVRVCRTRTFESPLTGEMESFLAERSDGPCA